VQAAGELKISVLARPVWQQTALARYPYTVLAACPESEPHPDRKSISSFSAVLTLPGPQTLRAIAFWRGKGHLCFLRPRKSGVSYLPMKNVHVVRSVIPPAPGPGRPGPVPVTAVVVNPTSTSDPYVYLGQVNLVLAESTTVPINASRDIIADPALTNVWQQLQREATVTSWV
jgi:hypothetical protein